MNKHLNDKIKALVDEYGFEDAQEMGEEYITQGTCPGICNNSGCNATYEYEHDSWRGWCEECNTPSVKSIYVLMGWI